jgi:hypothetical protein
MSGASLNNSVYSQQSSSGRRVFDPVYEEQKALLEKMQRDKFMLEQRMLESQAQMQNRMMDLEN